MSNGNFKVRCVCGMGNGTFTDGKIYDVKNGVIAFDNGQEWDGIDTINSLGAKFSSQFELVNDKKQITITEHRKKVVATIVDGDRKYSQYAKLSDHDGDFIQTAKEAFERVVDRFVVKDIEAVPPFDWEGFKSGKFAVHCDTEEKAREFLKECDEQGIKWNFGQKTTEWNISDCANKVYNCSQLKLTWGFKVDAYNVIDYTPSKPTVKEVSRKAEVGEWIRVTKDDGYSDNDYKVGDILKVVKNSDQSRSSGAYYKDEFCKFVGHGDYVVLENHQPEDKSIDSNPELEQPISSASMREVKREAKAGEYVKVVNARNVPVSNGKPEYQNGDILKIFNSNHGQVTYADGKSDNGRYRVLNTSEYVVLENYDYSLGFPKNEPFRKAKVGDKIKVVRDSGHLKSQTTPVNIGDVLMVYRVTSDGVFANGDCNYLADENQEYIIIEETPEVKPDTIEIGDTVKVIGIGRVCSTYGKFVEMYAKEFYSKYSKGYEPKTGDIGVVVGIGEHESYREDYLVVLANGKVFCIHPEGVEKVQ